MTKEQIKQIVKLTESAISKKLNENSNSTRMAQQAMLPLFKTMVTTKKAMDSGKLDSVNLGFLITEMEKALPKFKLIYKNI